MLRVSLYNIQYTMLRRTCVGFTLRGTLRIQHTTSIPSVSNSRKPFTVNELLKLLKTKPILVFGLCKY
jgi:hypothetical protein